jgi:hypothetical protein
MNDDERKAIYERHVAKSGRSTGNNMAAFFKATFEAWKDHKSSGREQFYVGYSPIITVDADRILRDLTQAHVLHVVRNPWSAFADTSKRPVPMSLANYMLGWTLNQYYALLFRDLYPDRVHIVRTEDVMRDPRGTLGAVCRKIGLEAPESLGRVSWNSQDLPEVFPWGTIRTPTPEANLATAKELSQAQIDEIRVRAQSYLDAFDYKNFLK